LTRVEIEARGSEADTNLEEIIEVLVADVTAREFQAGVLTLELALMRGAR
jgi:hypothetical protein